MRRMLFYTTNGSARDSGTPLSLEARRKPSLGSPVVPVPQLTAPRTPGAHRTLPSCEETWEVKCADPCSRMAKRRIEAVATIRKVAVRHAEALNRAAGFLRGRLGRQIEMKFTPQLHFIADHSYDEANDMNAVFRRAEVAKDLDPDED